MTGIKSKWNKIPVTAKVSIAYAVCSILQKCLSFITMPLFTRLLTTEQYGQFTVYQSWYGILSIFLTLNLAYGSFSTAMVRYEKDRNGYISAVEGICAVLSLIFMVIYLPFRQLWNKLFELPTPYICLMTAEILGTTAIQLWSGKKRFEFRYKAVVGLTLGISVLSPLTAYCLVVSSEEKGYARIIGYAAVSAVIGFIFFIFNAIKGRKIFDKAYWKYALKFNIPLLAYYLSQVIFNQSDRIMISHMQGTDKAAIYGVAYSLATVLIFVLNSINNAYVPWYYGKIKEGKQEENRSVSVGIAVLMAAMLSVIIWFAPEIIKIMAGEKYYEAVYVVPPVAVSLLLLFYAQLFINVEFYYEQKKKLVWASVGAALINIALNMIFINIFGFVAAAYTTLASYMIFAFANYMAMKQVIRENDENDTAYSYKALGIVFCCLCIISAVGAILYELLLLRITVLIIFFVAIIIKRKYFLNLFHKFKGNKK